MNLSNYDNCIFRCAFVKTLFLSRKQNRCSFPLQPLLCSKSMEEVIVIKCFIRVNMSLWTVVQVKCQLSV